MIIYSLFTLKTNYSFVAVLVYVDDIVVARDNISVIQHLKDFVHQKFSSKELGEIKYYLGIEILRSKDGFHLNQRKYALDLLA